MGIEQIDAFMSGEVPLGRVTCPARILTHDTKRLTHILLTSSRADNEAMWASQAFTVSQYDMKADHANTQNDQANHARI